MARGHGARRTPADRYARLAGAVLVVVGVIFLPLVLSNDAGGGWVVALYVVSGLLGVFAPSRWARDYALGFGLLYAAIGVWGLIAGFGTAGSLLNLALGLIGLGTGAATPAGSRPRPRPRTRRA